jgi:manganese/zinc/iron transport system ATP- binding protein
MLLNVQLMGIGPTAQVFTADNLQQTYGGRLTLLSRDDDAIIVGTR